MTLRFMAAIVLALAASPAAAQPVIANAAIRERAGADLAGTFRQLAGEPGPLWIGYAVEAQDAEWNACCWEDGHHRQDGCSGCPLEEGHRKGPGTIDRERRAVPLEPTRQVAVLYRVENAQVGRIRAYSAECALDAGGLPVYWLTGVRGADSVSLLTSFAEGDRPRRLLDPALMAIAAHRDATAEAALVQLARGSASTRVRGQALFWLAQKAGRKAAGVIAEAIDDDPETKIKERAVFALSQLPADEAVPKLIDVARNNRNPRVRRQAIFWLGQTRDPRALKFFEEILGKQ